MQSNSLDHSTIYPFTVAHARRTLAWQVINEIAAGPTPSDDQPEASDTERNSSTVVYGSFEGPA
jgi:hypothetical protein